MRSLRVVFLTVVSALAVLPSIGSGQQPSPAQMGITSTTVPEILQVLDKTGTWVTIGAVDSTNHAFTGYGSGTDVRAYGCVADGVTDQTACINNALTNAPDCVIIPASTKGFYVDPTNGPVIVKRCLRGTVFLPTNVLSGPPLTYANSSVILCNNQVAKPCVVANSGGAAGTNYPTQIQNVSILGKVGTPITGSIGFQWQSGYNLVFDNVQSSNFGTCAYMGPTAGAGLGPLRMHAYNANFSQCLNHYVVNDGIPELVFISGVWGGNGGTDYNSADDFYFATKTTSSGGGGGPNSLELTNVQLNPGNNSIGCAFRWGSFIANPPGAFGANKIIGSHIEVLGGTGYTGTKTKGFFCVDSTVPMVPEIKVIGTDFAEDSTPKTMPLFNIDPSVPFGNESRLTFIGNDIGVGPSTLTIHNVLFAFPQTFSANWFYNPMTFTAGDASAIAYVSDNSFFGNYTITGQWARLGLSNNFGTMTDTAMGRVNAGGDGFRNWTPTLTFGGNSVGITYGTQIGLIQRTAGGGYKALANITLTNKGTSVGNAQITGMPYNCANIPSLRIPVTLQNMAGLTGAVQVQNSGSNSSVAYITQAAATGVAFVTNTNFTNTSVFATELECGLAQ